MAPNRSKLATTLLGPMLATVGVVVGGALARSEDFRVDNEVFLGTEKKAASRSTTIFHDGVVYSFLEEPAEVIVFDKAGSRFVLLDMTRRIRAELTTEQVAAFTRRLQQRATTHEEASIRFLAAPKLDERFDEEANELTLASPWITYRLQLAGAESRPIWQQYREFSDWYVRLNTALNPGSKPPFARLLVNAALAKHEAIAQQVERTTTQKKGFLSHRTVVRSQHRLVRQLATADFDRVAQTRQFMEIFKPVSFAQYREAIGG